MNVPDSWVKEVCEKLGIPEPGKQLGFFWDDEEDWSEHLWGYFTGIDNGCYQCNNGSYWNNFKPLSSATIVMIKKDLGIE